MTVPVPPKCIRYIPEESERTVVRPGMVIPTPGSGAPLIRVAPVISATERIPGTLVKEQVLWP